MSKRWALALATAVAVLCVPGPACAAPVGGTGMTVSASDPSAVTVTLTNRGSAPCQVVADAPGTVTLSAVRQGGPEIAPLATLPSYVEDPGRRLASELRILAPGASVRLPLPAVPEGPTGHALRTFSWSGFTVAGALFPVVAGKPLALTAAYTPPVPVISGPPLCAAAVGSTAAVAHGTTAKTIRWYAAGAVLLIVVLLLVLLLLLLLRRKRRRGAAAAAAVVIAVALSVISVAAHPGRAEAKIIVDDGRVGASAQNCENIFDGGYDPSHIMGALEGSSTPIKILYGIGGDGEEKVSGTIFIYYDPNDHTPYADGVAATPCDDLYHELYHAFEDLPPNNVDNHECWTAAGPSGIAIKEVNATRAENKLRAAKGDPLRTTYGPHKLPSGPCVPHPGAQVCDPTKGCASPPPPAPQKEEPPPAHTTADPHLLTFDGLRYDFQAAGEFTAVEDGSATGANAMTLQVRQQPWGNSRTVAVTTAAAADVGGDRIEVDAHDQAMTLLVGGRPTALGAVRLPHGGAIAVGDSTGTQVLTVTWPDGTYALFNLYGSTLTIAVHASADRAGKLTGLLGDDDGHTLNDLRVGGRTITGAFPELYPAYADGMRITQAASLFTYAAGTSTATYTLRGFPARPDVAAGTQAWARSICAGYGVTDPAALADCVTDVANTGNASFLGSAVAEEAVAEAAPPPSTGAGGGTSSTLALSQPGKAVTYRFAGTAGQHLYISYTTTLPNACGEVTLADPAGHALATGCITDGAGSFDAVTLQATGDYRVTVRPPAGVTGQLVLHRTTVTDQADRLTVDGPPVAATVANAGAHADLSFTGTAGEIIYVRVTASTLPNACGVLRLNDAGGATLASGCIINGAGSIDRTVLPAGGVFTVRVDPAGTVTGSAQVQVISATDQTGTLTIGGPPVTATIDRPGAVSRFTFAGRAGQTVTLFVSAATVNGCGVVSVDDATGANVGSACIIGTAGSSSPIKLPAAGVYTVVVDPYEGNTGRATLTLR